MFQPHGRNKKVSEYLSRQLNEDSINIDLTDRKRDFRDIALTGNDIAVIAVPSYGGRVPSPAVERIKQIQGNGAKAIIVCVYGNRAYEDTLAELLDCTQQAGFSVIAAVAAIAKHNAEKGMLHQKRMRTLHLATHRQVPPTTGSDKPALQNHGDLALTAERPVRQNIF